MTFEQRRAAAVSSWVVAMGIAGIIAGIATPAGWGIVLAIVLIPAIVAMWLSTPPPATISARTRSGRR